MGVKRLAEIHEATKKDLKGSVAFLKIQALIWRDVAAISTFNPVRGRRLAKSMVVDFIPYGGPNYMENLEKLHDELLPEAQKAGFISGIFDFYHDKLRGKREQSLWAKQLQKCLNECIGRADKQRRPRA